MSNQYTADGGQNGMPEMDSETLKKEIFSRMNARQRKFVERIGYDAWDPFEPPNEPMDMRTDKTRHTVRQLVAHFQASAANARPDSQEYSRGVLECAFCLIRNEEKFLGIFDFCRWYADFLQQRKDIP